MAERLEASLVSFLLNTPYSARKRGLVASAQVQAVIANQKGAHTWLTRRNRPRMWTPASIPSCKMAFFHLTHILPGDQRRWRLRSAGRDCQKAAAAKGQGIWLRRNWQAFGSGRRNRWRKCRCRRLKYFTARKRRSCRRRAGFRENKIYRRHVGGAALLFPRCRRGRNIGRGRHPLGKTQYREEIPVWKGNCVHEM